ncbi:MAG: hypothetical protein K6T65_08830 [Peptococcaceae bacterium]|nr:hypothetical protein [Peptococcaceae bacterium]
MRNKKFILIIALITLLTAFFVYSPAFAGPAEEEKLRRWSEGQNISPAEVGEAARVVTNDELFLLIQEDYFKQLSKQGKPFNPLSFDKYWSLAYDDEHGTVDDNAKFPWAKWRYIGYTNKDEAFTNFWFRPDFVPGGGFHIDKARWIEKPFYSPLVSQFLTQMGEPGLEDNPFLPDNPMVGSKLRPHIAWGLKALAIVWPEWYKFDAKASPIQDWENYAHILQPPSYWCWGTGRMFHQARDGSIWYLDVPLPPGRLLEFDLKAELEKDSYQGKPGEKIDTTATFSLAQGYDSPVEAKLRVYIETENDIIELPFTPVDPMKTLDGGKYTFRPGESLEVNVSFTVPNGPAELVTRIEPVLGKGRTIIEKDSANNEDRAPIVSGLQNLVALRIDSGVSGEAVPGVRYTAAVDLQNQSDIPLFEVPVGGFHREYRAVLKDRAGNPVKYADFGPGEIKTFYFDWTAPGELSETVLIGAVDADPVEDRYAETNEDDNTIEVTVPIQEVAFDPGEGDLTFQAYSKPGTDLHGNWQEERPREPDTAKWTDRVVATLRVPAPKPPKGTLVSWSITSASLTYPRQNPEFCRGNPVEPIDGDTVTIDMDTHGHTATAEFEEDWSIAGYGYGTEAAGIYNMMTGEVMASEPKAYRIAADWVVEYTYEYQIPHRSCHRRSDGTRSCRTWYETVRKTGTASGTAAGRLTVNGAGTYHVF